MNAIPRTTTGDSQQPVYHSSTQGSDALLWSPKTFAHTWDIPTDIHTSIKFKIKILNLKRSIAESKGNQSAGVWRSFRRKGNDFLWEIKHEKRVHATRGVTEQKGQSSTHVTMGRDTLETERSSLCLERIGTHGKVWKIEVNMYIPPNSERT